MTWKAIRLELARTREFPTGSVSRAYLLRLPLRADGMVDQRAVEDEPARATVRRFWPSEPDRVGYILPDRSGWKFTYELGETGDAALLHLESHALRIGEYVTVTEPGGRRLPFRVASLRTQS